MNENGLWIRLLKKLYELSLYIIGIFCIIMYWNSELIIDKIHYGIFLLAI